MTRTEAWLTGVGAVLALTPSVFIVGFVRGDEGLNSRVLIAAALLAVPGVFALLALAAPDRREIRLMLTAAAALVLIPASLVTYLVLFPALATLSWATAVSARRLNDQNDASWPSPALIAIAPAFWLAAGAFFIMRSASGCSFFDSSIDIACSRGSVLERSQWLAFSLPCRSQSSPTSGAAHGSQHSYSYAP